MMRVMRHWKRFAQRSGEYPIIGSVIRLDDTLSILIK